MAWHSPAGDALRAKTDLLTIFQQIIKLRSVSAKVQAEIKNLFKDTLYA